MTTALSPEAQILHARNRFLPFHTLACSESCDEKGEIKKIERALRGKEGMLIRPYLPTARGVLSVAVCTIGRKFRQYLGI